MSSSAPMPSRILIDGLLLCSVVCVGWRPLLAQEEPSHSVPAQETAAELHGLEGPADANLGTVAQLKIPAGMDFLGADDAAEFATTKRFDADTNKRSRRGLRE